MNYEVKDVADTSLNALRGVKGEVSGLGVRTVASMGHTSTECLWSNNNN